MMKKKSTKTLKAKAWKAFARFIKARDADKNGMVVCCTCNCWMKYNEPKCNAGHFIGGRGGAVLFDEMGVHCQCASCNGFKNGEQFLYGLFMKRKYNLTDDQLKQMRIDANKPRPRKDFEYIELAEEYNNKADALIAMKGL